MGEYLLSPQMRVWMVNRNPETAYDFPYRVKYIYREYHGSDGTLECMIPRVDRVENESDYEFKFRYWLKALRTVAEVIRDREDRLFSIDEHEQYRDEFERFSKRKSDVTIR